jgi:hypothetical protein
MPYPLKTPRPEWRLTSLNPFGTTANPIIPHLSKFSALESIKVGPDGNCESASLSTTRDSGIGPNDIITIEAREPPAAFAPIFCGSAVVTPNPFDPGLIKVELIGLKYRLGKQFMPAFNSALTNIPVQQAFHTVLVDAEAIAPSGVDVATYPGFYYQAPPVAVNYTSKNSALQSVAAMLESIVGVTGQDFTLSVYADRKVSFRAKSGNHNLSYAGLEKARVVSWHPRDTRNYTSTILWQGPITQPFVGPGINFGPPYFSQGAPVAREPAFVTHNSFSGSAFGAFGDRKPMPSTGVFAKRQTVFSSISTPGPSTGWNMYYVNGAGSIAMPAAAIDGDETTFATLSTGVGGVYDRNCAVYLDTTGTPYGEGIRGVRVRIRGNVKYHVRARLFHTTGSVAYGMPTTTVEEFTWFDCLEEIKLFYNGSPTFYSFLSRVEIEVRIVTPTNGEQFDVFEIAPFELDTAALDEQAKAFYDSPGDSPAVVRVNGILAPRKTATVTIFQPNGTPLALPTADIAMLEYRIEPGGGFVTDVHLEKRRAGGLLAGVFPKLRRDNVDATVAALERRLIL